MAEETPPKETPPETPTDPKELSKEDLEQVAGGGLPGPIPRLIAPLEPVLPVADLPGPMPDTYQRIIRR